MITPTDLGFPSTSFLSYRERQLEIATEAAMSPRRFYVLNLPVGGGKSLICQTYAKLRGGRTLTLAPTKDLQLQLERDFDDLTNIYGHGHYGCSTSTVADGEMEFECPVASECDYRPIVRECLDSSNVLTNPAHWVNILKSGDRDRLGKFDNLVIDEAHRIHDMLCDYISFTVTPQRVYRLLRMEITPSVNPMASIAGWYEWAKVVCGRCVDEIGSLESRADNGDPVAVKQIRRIAYLQTELTRFTDSFPQTEWVAAPIPYTDRHVKLTPVWGREFAEQYLFGGIPNVFLCSGTIQEESLKDLGITTDNYAYRDEESLFPPDRSPFVYIPTVTVNARMSQSERGVLVRRIDQIIRESLAYKGTIQATGYEWARSIYEMSEWRGHSDVILPGIDRDSARESYEYFNSSRSHPPNVLLSPTIKEGLDLHGDKCRYQVIPKIPYPNMVDPLTAARSKSDKRYMIRMAAQTLEQMKGRSTRSRDDWSVTFLLDDGWDTPWVRKTIPLSKSFRRCQRRMEGVRGIAGMYKTLDR